MNAFERLLSLPEAEKEQMGVAFTPAEIAQQPAMWRKTVDILRERRAEIAAFMRATGLTGAREATVLLTGAGTSEFVGNAICPALRSGLKREVISVPTTHFVTHTPDLLVPGHPYVLVSFARSGNSPESLATVELVKHVSPGTKHVFVTCNKDGALARAADDDPACLCLLLPEETNDRSLVMTSSFSTMAFAALGLCFTNRLDSLAALADRLGTAADRLIHEYGDLLHAFAQRPFTRAAFLGSGVLYGTMQECHLKMQEMTEGRVACRFDSFLGLRHGPQVFVNSECVVIAALASNPSVRRYEMDLLRELKTKKQGCGTLVICDRGTDDIRQIATDIVELCPDEEPVDDAYRVMTDVVAGQILGTFKSIAVGLKPDAPSATGTINRVVQGVVIYSHKGPNG
ncbi:MAG: SIS domain-containing protein [Kiritimatiellae bacterium]|nr:SIS domain-containing protein [Kiritimatiellia bacterium]